MRTLLPASILLWLFNLVQGQSLSIPPTWQHTTLSLSRDERIQIAQAGLDYTFNLRYFNHTDDPTNNYTGTFPGFPIWDSANMLWTMALKDRIANTTNNIQVMDAIRGFGKHYPQYQDSPQGIVMTPLNWGLAAMTAYLSYGRQDMLAIAQSTWDYVSQYQITEDQAKQGQHPLRNVTFSHTCNDVSVAGAVFTDQSPQSLYADAQLINHFILLSAYLAEQTGNQTYLDAAKLSANFIFQHLYDSASQLVETDFTIGATDPECKVNLTATKRPHSSGKYMEALSVLQSRDDDPKWPSMILQVLAGAAHHDWPSTPEGVMKDAFAFTDDDKQYKGKFFRSLYEVMLRSNRTDVHDLITSFINVQANSILQNATITGTNFYTSNWTGPPETSFTIAGALTSLDVLVVAIGPSPSQGVTGVTTSSASPSPTTTYISHSGSRNVALQVGLGIGLPVCAFLTLLGVWWFVRRRRRRSPDFDHKITDRTERPAVGPQMTMLNHADVHDPTPIPLASNVAQHMYSHDPSSTPDNFPQAYRTRKTPVGLVDVPNPGLVDEAPPMYEASASTAQRTRRSMWGSS